MDEKSWKISVNFPPITKTVILEVTLIGNPVSNRLEHGFPIKAFGDDNLHGRRIVLIRISLDMISFHHHSIAVVIYLIPYRHNEHLNCARYQKRKETEIHDE